jgi:NIPSNAP
MIVDVRTNTLIPRKLAKYVEIFEKHGLPVMKRHGLDLMGYYVSYIGALNQVVHLWRYLRTDPTISSGVRRRWREFPTLTKPEVATILIGGIDP